MGLVKTRRLAVVPPQQRTKRAMTSPVRTPKSVDKSETIISR